MSTQPLTPQRRPRTTQSPQSLGTIVLGGILILVGLAWILDVLDVVNLTVGVVLPSALILVGIALLAGSISGSHGGLVALGVVLTVILTVTASVNVPLNGGIGDQRYAPAQITDLSDRYQLMIGNLDVDLSRVDFPPGVTTVEARVGLGQVNVEVPAGVAVMVHYRLSAGSIETLDKSLSGSNLDGRVQTPGYDSAAKKLVIEASVGFGDIKVRQP